MVGCIEVPVLPTPISGPPSRASLLISRKCAPSILGPFTGHSKQLMVSNSQAACVNTPYALAALGSTVPVKRVFNTLKRSLPTAHHGSPTWDRTRKVVPFPSATSCIYGGHKIRSWHFSMLPPKCSFCFLFGHHASLCKKQLYSRSRRWVPKQPHPPLLPPPASGSNSSPSLSLVVCSTSPEGPSSPAVMANFPVDPFPFIPQGGVLSDGGGELRKQRRFITLSGQHIRRNEDMAIAECDAELNPMEQQEFLQLIHQCITQNLRQQVLRYSIYPLGVGIFKLAGIFQRDWLVSAGPFWIGERLVRFVKHDEAVNHKNSPASRIGWVMFFAFPLDFKDINFLEQVVASFGKILYWHSEDSNLSRVLLKVLFDSTINIPRSITVKSCHSMNGEGRSWTFPVYILNNELADGFPADEDNLPPDGGNPHPFNGQVFPGEPAWIQQWVDDQMVNGAFQPDNLEVDPFPDNLPDLNGAVAGELWDNWPEGPAQQPQSPLDDQPQEEISMELSAISNPSNSTSAGHSSQSALMILVDSSSAQVQPTLIPGVEPNVEGINVSTESQLNAPASLLPRQISLVYKRRRYNTAFGPSSPKEDVQPLLSSQPLNDSRVISDVGLRRSVRLQMKSQGLRLLDISWQMASASSQAIAQGNSKGKEVVLPLLPSVQDYANPSSSGMALAPLSIGQIHHTAVRLCGLLAEQVTEDKLTAEPSLEIRLAKVTETTQSQNEDSA
ncbi:hypothetical protein GUJ93_ZPchr0004g40149 [Zizania palustris]|uniref:DUF7597 domain-containing protein n=1 Tax=Zizania palustris TaxID=103762 RepID=A0A8J5VFS6_ZIZPA|nr:hypothetical protein GUJ93_ZPchr0004g40149 [Zizania palustris]